MERSQVSKSSVEALKLSDLHYQYKGRQEEALRGVSLSLKSGGIYGILGPNGSGKSTCFKIISTQTVATQGEAFVFGLSSRSEASALRECIGVCFQAPSLDPILTVKENLEVQAALMGLDALAAQTEIARWLKELGLVDRAAERVATLSGGLARRVELAKSLLHKPRLLLLDEPTVGLDPTAREDFWKSLKRLQAEGMTIVVTTHLMDEAELCDELYFLSKGRCVASGTPEALKNDFHKEFVFFQTKTQIHSAEELQNLVPEGCRVSRVHARYRIESQNPLATLEWVKNHFSTSLVSLEWTQATLGDVYKEKTGVDLNS